MKLLALVLLALPLAAAPWDGQRGPFALLTITSPQYIPGAANINPPGTPPLTILMVHCADSTVTAIRFTVTYEDGTDLTLLSDVGLATGFGGVILTRAGAIGVKLTALRDGEVY